MGIFIKHLYSQGRDSLVIDYKQLKNRENTLFLVLSEIINN